MANLLYDLAFGSGVMNPSAQQNFILNNNYAHYESYKDIGNSRVTKDKNIIVDSVQVCVKNETNAQYITFKMPRYFDNIDLNTMNISIVGANANNEQFIDIPVNMMYSANLLKFGWLIRNNVTKYAGTVKFEIHAVGTVESEEYHWKTKPNGMLQVVGSMDGEYDGDAEISEDMFASFILQSQEEIAKMSSMVAEVKANLEKTKTYSEESSAKASEATTKARDAEVSANRAKTYCESALEVVSNAYNDSVAIASAKKSVEEATKNIAKNVQTALNCADASRDKAASAITSARSAVESATEARNILNSVSEIYESVNSQNGSMSNRITTIESTLRTLSADVQQIKAMLENR